MFENILQAKLKICQYEKITSKVTITLSLINSNKDLRSLSPIMAPVKI